MRDRFLWIGALLYAVLFTVLGAIKYAGHRNLVDFGIFAQTVASAFGCFCNTIEGSHWAYHFSPVLYVAGAVVSVARSPITIIAMQSVACALVAPPVGAIVAARAGRNAARLAALVTWLYPPLAGLAFGDFHENVFAPAVVAWLLWAVDSGYHWLVLLFALCALAVKEDQAIFLFIGGMLGTWQFRRTAMGRVALAIVAVSGAVLAWFYLGIQPHAAKAMVLQWSPTRFYAWTAGDVRALFPAGILARFGFIVLAFVPLLLLPLRSRFAWLAAAPLAEVLLSRMSTTYTIGSHYAGAWIGYVLAPFAFATREIDEPRLRRILWLCVALCLVEFAVADPLHPGLNLHRPQARDVALDRFLATLPRNIDVATQEEAYTHMALDDPRATLLPETASTHERACFILIDEDYPDSPRLQEYGSAVQAFIRARQYVLVRRTGAIVLYKRRMSTESTTRCTQSPSTR
jgi:uncharacterized membrane protein